MKEQQLKDILNTMDVPEGRKKDWGWLMRNLSVRNSDHPKFNEAVGLLKSISRNNCIRSMVLGGKI